MDCLQRDQIAIFGNVPNARNQAGQREEGNTVSFLGKKNQLFPL